MHELVTTAVRFHHPGPSNNEGHAMPSFPGIGLVPTQWSTGIMPHLFQVGHSNVRCAAIVAGKDDQRILRRTTLLERAEHLPHYGVGFHYEIGVEVQFALSFPLVVNGQGGVRRGQGHVNEERFGRLCLPRNKSRHPIPQCRENRLKCPSLEGRSLLAGLIFDEEFRCGVFTGNADGTIILNEAVGRPVGNVRSKILVKADCNRSSGNGLGENLTPSGPVFVCGGEVLFTPVTRTRKQFLLFRGDRPIPTQVPLANASGVVSLFLGQSTNGQAIRGNDWWPPKTHDASL